MPVSLELLDAETAEPAILEGAHRCLIEMEEEWFPGQPPTPFQHHLSTWRVPPASHRTDLRWVAVDRGRVVGTSHAVTWVDHADSGLVEVAVDRNHRHRGIGRQLLTEAIDWLASRGRSKLIIDIPIGSPHEAQAERLGLKRVFSERINQMKVSDLDHELMKAWIDRAGERAGGYRLLAMRAPLPDQHMGQWCRISDAMNTAPMEDFDLEDTRMTEEKWRSIEAHFAARGFDLHALVAVHEQTGNFAGMTTLIYQRHHPKLALQDDTVVDPDHRNKGLGRLLKASMALGFLKEHPRVELINTGNAGSNAPMLAINEEMGFKTILEVGAWQGDIATARESMNS